MSFSDQVRNEITREKNSEEDCHLAELAAIIKVEGSLQIANHKTGLKMVSQKAVVARELYKLLKEKYNFKTEIRVGKKSSFDKGNYYIINIPPQEGIKDLLIEIGLIDENFSFNHSIKSEFLKKQSCRKAYLKGLFLATGMLADPNSEYHLEFFVKYEDYAEELIELFNKIDIDIKMRKRKENYSLYIKKAEDIIKILNLIGAKSTQLKIENTRILKEVKNEVNRKVNLETANLSRTAIAAQKQLENIEFINRTIGLNKVSSSLQEIAELRKENPFASLKELGEMIGISKSGVNHRLRRVKKIAEDIKENNLEVEKWK